MGSLPFGLKAWPFLIGLALTSCSGDKPKGKKKGQKNAKAAEVQGVKNRVIVLAFEGADPDWLERWRRSLPTIDNILRVRKPTRLLSTLPSGSATIWTSFALGQSPGQHGIFSERVRLDGYHWGPSTISVTPSVLDAAGKLSSPPVVESRISDPPFWRVAADAGKKVKLLWVPYAYPLDDLGEGSLAVGGIGIPSIDLGASQGVLLTTRDDDPSSFGVSRILLTEGEGGAYEGAFPGPISPDGQRVTLPVTISRTDERVTLTHDGEEVLLRKGAWSDWITLRFQVSDFHVVEGVTRLYPTSLDDDIQVFAYPLGPAPFNPYAPISQPASFAKERWESAPFNPSGVAQANAGLASGALTEDGYMKDLNETFERRVRKLVAEVKKADAELVVAGFNEAESIARMFTRLADPSHPAYNSDLASRYGGMVKEAYAMMDDVIAALQKELDPSDRLLIVSNHGNQTVRKAFDPNAWLEKNGYLRFRPGKPSMADGLADGQGRDVDWARTRAYAIGGAAIHLNIKGREPAGSVAPQGAAALSKEIATKLQKVTDGKKPVFSLVVSAADLFPDAEDSPALFLNFADGYGVAPGVVDGAVGTEILADNKTAWSANHLGLGAGASDGLILVNTGELPGTVRVEDIAPTVLTLLEVPVPETMTGTALEL